MFMDIIFNGEMWRTANQKKNHKQEGNHTFINTFK